MDENTVRERLAKLQAELQDAHQDHPETRGPLGEILPEVKRMAEGAAVSAALPERLERVAVQFEAKHPKLAASVRRLVDLLGEVGI
jgi:hypothetical protein